MKKLSTEDFIELCRQKYIDSSGGSLYTYDKTVYTGANNNVTVTCPIHGDFKKLPSSFLRAGTYSYCPECVRESSRKSKEYKFIENAREIHVNDDGTPKYDYTRVHYKNQNIKVTITCPVHGDFLQTPFKHVHERQGCPKCAADMTSGRLTFSKEYVIQKFRDAHGDFYDYSRVEYTDSVTKVSVICPIHGDFEITPVHHWNGSSCPRCAAEKMSLAKRSTTEEFITKASDLHKDYDGEPEYDYSNVQYEDSRKKVEIICPVHGPFLQKPNSHLNGQGCPICGSEKCSSHTISEGELEMRSFIETYVPVKAHDRNLIYPQELDIYVPSKNLAVEFNGIYYHSTANPNIDKNYHLRKTEKCVARGIHLVHIFEDEWNYKREIVRSILKQILNISSSKIYARTCEIREVSSADARMFLEKNHIQGFVGSAVRLGLYYKEILVSMMTFGHRRINLGSSREDRSWELIRYCSVLDTNVVGGASRLLRFFEKTYAPKKLVSYCDKRLFTGNLYGRLGFALDHESPPNYYYVINRRRENRFKYRKSELVKAGYDATLTEEEIMKSRGIPRIYDCGCKVFVKNYE